MTNQQLQTPSGGFYRGKLSNKVCPQNMTVEQWQIALRRENAKDANYEVEHLDDNRIWGDYLVSGKTGRYRVAFRGVLSDRNYCSCLDFRTNGLGTCKHIEAVTLRLSDEVPGYPWANLTYNPPYSSLYVSYKGGRSVQMRVGESHQQEYVNLRSDFFDESGALYPHNYNKLEEICSRGSAIDSAFRCYDDVFDFVRESRTKQDWSRGILTDYPEGIITDGFVYEPSDGMRRKVWQMASRGYGLISNVPQRIAIVEVLSLARVVMSKYSQSTPGYIIIDRYVDMHAWQIAMLHPSVSDAAIVLITAQEFIKRISDMPLAQRNIPFVYVDNADPLKEWRNPLSIALKAAFVSHLYMRISTLRTLTPVQVSSVLQHISPYILGPFYRFIHTYRPVFPLMDDGSNMPPEIAGFVFVYDSDEAIQESEFKEQIPITDHTQGITSDERVQSFLEATDQLLRDPEAVSRLCLLLKQLLRK